jgi:hypothetical protein
MPVGSGEDARHIGAILNKISDARMDYLGSGEYDIPLEDAIGASAFDVLSRRLQGEQVDDAVLLAATSAILTSLSHIDGRTTDAGFLHPMRLESILTRGD